MDNRYTREESLKLMRDAFNKGQLGAQKGASGCRYYDAETDSHCIIGVLIGKNRDLMNDLGNIIQLPNNNSFISWYMDDYGLDTFNGLTMEEAKSLQSLHDRALDLESKEILNDLKTYLFSLT